MLMIRLQRVGRKHEPVFRLVLTDSKNGPKSGKFLEILGSYDARRSEKAEFKTDRVKALMSTGAKLSDTVHNLLVERKVIEGKKINKLPKKKAPAVAAEAEEKKEETQAKTQVEEVVEATKEAEEAATPKTEEEVKEEAKTE